MGIEEKNELLEFLLDNITIFTLVKLLADTLS